MDNYRTLEVKLISAENLKHVSNPFSSKMNVYALVYMISNANNDTIYHEKRREERTRRDRTGGCNPTWNSTFRFVVPVVDAGTTTTTGLSLRIVLRTGHGIGDRDVGELTVPLGELLAGSNVAHDENFTVSKRVSYQLVRRDKKADSEGSEADADGDGGVLNLSYRFLRIMDTLRPRTATTEYNRDSFTAPPTLRPGTSTETKVAALVGALFVGL